MKRALVLLSWFAIGTGAFAQDVDFGAFDEPGALLAPAAPAGRGAAPARGAAAPSPPPDRLVRLRDALAKSEQPLTKDQEAELNKLLAAEIPVMRRTLQTHGQQMMAARAAASPSSDAARGEPSTPAAPAAPPNPPAPPAARGAPP